MSDSGGKKDWVLPSEQLMKWDNPLTAITKHANYEFNFVFKNGNTSDMLQGKATEVVQINPPDSDVRKIVVGYFQSDYVSGFKLFDANNVCVPQIGAFDWQ